MKTLVFQSYRTTDVPAWVAACLESVASWAEGREFGYRRLGDEFLAEVPEDYAAQARHNIFLVTDLARLNAAARFLQEGWNRVLWLDADVLVFRPDRFLATLPEREAFLEESWFLERADDSGHWQRKVSNAVMFFPKGGSFLEFYRKSCERLVRSGVPGQEEFGRSTPCLELGPDFLTRRDAVRPLERLRGVAHLMPETLAAIVSGGGPTLDRFVRASSEPYSAAHLCHSSVGNRYRGLEITHPVLEAVVRQLRGPLGDRLADRPAS